MLIDDEARLLKSESYLMHVRSLSMLIRSKKEQIEFEQECTLSGVDYGEKITVQPTRDAIDNHIISLAALVDTYNTELAEYIEAKKEAAQVLKKLSKPEYTVALTSYYMNCYTWEQVCVDMNYSWGGMMKLRQKAIIELYDHIPEFWKSAVVPDAQID